MINPKLHPRRHAEQIERRLADRGRALAFALSAEAAAKKLDISVSRAEQIAAKFGYAYQPSRKKQ